MYIYNRLHKGINKHLIHLHFIVFLWGFTPLLGRVITLNPVSMIWYRTGLTMVALWFWFSFFKKDSENFFHFSIKDFLKAGLVGLIIAVHWVFFYKAIQVSNISVTMMGFSTGTLFSSLLEPWFFRRKFRWYELLLGLGIVSGISMIFYTSSLYREGLCLGILAAFTSSFFGIMNGVLVKSYPASFISRIQMLFAFAGLSVFMWITGHFQDYCFSMDKASLYGLLALTFVCTIYPYLATLNLLRHISPFTITLTVNLETVYGILWGILFYREHKEMTLVFVAGMLIILLCVFLNPVLKKYFL